MAVMFVSVTRLRIRSVIYLVPFFWMNERAVRQLMRARGFHRGKLLVERGLTFWTMTAWQDERAMRDFRSSGAHKRAMPRLVSWCDEASVVHWQSETAELPDWQTAARRMTAEGRLSPVERPSAAQVAGKFAPPRPRSFIERTIIPAS